MKYLVDLATLALTGACAYVGGALMTGIYGFFDPVTEANYFIGLVLMTCSALGLAWIMADPSFASATTE